MPSPSAVRSRFRMKEPQPDRVSWTADDAEALIAFMRAAMSDTEIAEYFECEPADVAGARRSLTQWFARHRGAQITGKWMLPSDLGMRHAPRVRFSSLAAQWERDGGAFATMPRHRTVSARYGMVAPYVALVPNDMAEWSLRQLNTYGAASWWYDPCGVSGSRGTNHTGELLARILDAGSPRDECALILLALYHDATSRGRNDRWVRHGHPLMDVVSDADEWVTQRKWWEEWHPMSTRAIPDGWQSNSPWPMSDDYETPAKITFDETYRELRRRADAIASNHTLIEAHMAGAGSP